MLRELKADLKLPYENRVKKKGFHFQVNIIQLQLIKKKKSIEKNNEFKVGYLKGSTSKSNNKRSRPEERKIRKISDVVDMGNS